jgi:hypothetical protein
MALCRKWGPYRNGLLRLVWKNLTGLHRALTSTPSNTFGMSWNADWEPGLIAQHQRGPNLTNVLVAEWKQVPAAMFQRLVESLPRRVKAGIAAKGVTKSILILMILEWDVWRVGVHIWSCSVYSLCVWTLHCIGMLQIVCFYELQVKLFLSSFLPPAYTYSWSWKFTYT